MTIVWLLLALVVLAVAVPLVRAELRMRRRADLELPPDLTGSDRARAKRAKLTELKYNRRVHPRPGSNTSDGSTPGSAADGGTGHGGG
jgi:hypothetical protein